MSTFVYEPLSDCTCVLVCVYVCTGWRFGAVYGKSGVFPCEYVRPVAAPDFLVLPAERLEPRDRQGRVAASAAVAVAMGSAIAAHELDLSTEVQTRMFFSHSACTLVTLIALHYSISRCAIQYMFWFAEIFCR